MEQSEGAEEFLENTKLEMYHDQVFCFTPKGDIIALPRGSDPGRFRLCRAFRAWGSLAWAPKSTAASCR